MCRSNSNQRVERIWVDVGKQFARPWRAFLTRLEELHQLDHKNPHHLWLIHSLFLQEIDNDCEVFRETWNNHPISKEGMNKSPYQMRFIADVEVGTYVDDYDDVDPRLLQQYYGVSQRWRSRAAADETGAGHSDNDTDDEDDEDADGPITARLAHSQRRNLRHAPVEVPSSRCPFTSPEMEQSFWEAFRDAEEKAWLPDGCDIKPGDWARQGWGGYPESAQMKIGRKKKKYVISLPSPVWLPRAERWCRALHIMTAYTRAFDL
ncbi:hypothetical protein PENSPDRAFT_595555 [Peniophora sp. CONT]|nr:hypothetical protein PENSPDRAFT_595555 [Peniophora sp. CONT]